MKLFLNNISSLKVVFPLLLLLISCSNNNLAKISRALDGDTFELTENGQKFKVRLEGIDCPESNQPFGQEATVFAMQYLNKNVTYISHGTDIYNRVLIYPHPKKLGFVIS